VFMRSCCHVSVPTWDPCEIGGGRGGGGDEVTESWMQNPMSSNGLGWRLGVKKNCIFAYLILSNFFKLDNIDFIHDN